MHHRNRGGQETILYRRATVWFGVVITWAVFAGGCTQSPVSSASCERGDFAESRRYTCENGFKVRTNADVLAGDVQQDGGDAETDVRPGCSPNCSVGEICVDGTDCSTGVCEADGTKGRTCQAASCSDGVQNGQETAIDCGGPDCVGCGMGADCLENRDCASGFCANEGSGEGVCASAQCDDGKQNGEESDTDCGGPNCPGCESGEDCSEPLDCRSGVCDDGTCAAPSCSDGVRNGEESAVDCGGSMCKGCEAGKSCNGPEDCASGVCNNSTCQAPSCNDGVQNGGERDIDCGGGCGRCGAGQTCSDNSHCVSGVCKQMICQMPTCTDGVKNGTETDVDCGGMRCPLCEADDDCSGDGDCKSGVCDGSTCAAPACDDGVRNGTETDVDCGGPDCSNKCDEGKMCNGDSDCISGDCSGGMCVPSCSDGDKNQGETDTDCGGPNCSGCQPGDACMQDSDCEGANVCNSSNTCQVQLHQTTKMVNGNAVTAVQWTDSPTSYAASCDDYRNPTKSNYAYAGATGDGMFWIKPSSASSPTRLKCRFVSSSGSSEGWTRVYYEEYTSSPGTASEWAPNDDYQQCGLPGYSSPNYVLGGDGANFKWGGDQQFSASATLSFEADVPHSEVDFDAVFIRDKEWECMSCSNGDEFELEVAGTTVYGPAVPGPVSTPPAWQTVCGEDGRLVELDTQTTPVSRGASPPASVSVTASSDNTGSDEWWALDDVAIWVH